MFTCSSFAQQSAGAFAAMETLTPETAVEVYLCPHKVSAADAADDVLGRNLHFVHGGMLSCIPLGERRTDQPGGDHTVNLVLESNVVPCQCC